MGKRVEHLREIGSEGNYVWRGMVFGRVIRLTEIAARDENNPLQF